MPYVSEAAARAVLAQAGELPVAPAFRGQRGFPVFLPAYLRPKLLGLRGDVGARDFLSDCVLVPWEEPGVILDLDRPEDLEVKPS
jgi:CTP:molybdopterin cytidylyltransferase MocA